MCENRFPSVLTLGPSLFPRNKKLSRLLKESRSTTRTYFLIDSNGTVQYTKIGYSNFRIVTYFLIIGDENISVNFHNLLT